MSVTSNTKTEDIVFRLARNICDVSYEDIPRAAVEITKKSIMDTLGIIIAASTTSPGCRDLVDMVTEGGGKPESTILGFGGKVPAWMAAFANGAMSHCLDYDDTHDGAMVHPGITTIPAALAVAERIGKVSGKEFITAVTLGGDLICRLGLAIFTRPQGYTYDWMMSAVLGVFSSAAAAGKLLGLNEEKMVDALGIAFSHAAGTIEIRAGDSIIGGFYASAPNMSGVMSALMAQRGITGIKNSMEGKYGLFNMYFGGSYNRDALTADLGKKFEYANVSFKPWPSCRGTHPYVDATLALLKEHNIKPGDVKHITLYVGDITRRLCEPLELRQQPATTFDAKFSIPWTVACAVARQNVAIADYTDKGIKDPVALKLAQRITAEYDEDVNGHHGVAPGKVRIDTSDGQSYVKRVDVIYGHPSRPLTMDDLTTKFKDCVSYSAKPIDRRRTAQVVDAISNLEQQDDVGRISALLTGGA